MAQKAGTPGRVGGDVSTARRWVAITLRAAGNVMLGGAVGLLGYYAMTTIVARLDQQHLRRGAPSALVATHPDRLVIDPGEDRLAFDGWQREDRAAWLRQKPGSVFGRLVIERMKLDTLVMKGVRRSELRQGPGWIPWTDLPGPSGNVGISGHRTTYGAPFFRIDELREGDVIDFYSPWRRYRYTVDRTRIVSPSQGDVVAHTDPPRLTLTACHPRYSARYRIVVSARLVEVVTLKGAGK